MNCAETPENLLQNGAPPHVRRRRRAPHSRYEEVIAYLRAFHDSAQRPPTTKEATQDLRIPRASLNRIIDGLAREGALVRHPVGTLRIFFPHSPVTPSPASAERETAAAASTPLAAAATFSAVRA